MKKRTYLLSLFMIILSLSSCEMFEPHPYDTHVRGKTDLNNIFIKEITESLKDKKKFRFAFISDTQRWYNDTKDLVKDINRHKDIDFIIHGGDLSDFGATNEFTLQRDIMLDFNSPWVTLLGNHDCLGTGEDVYQRIWGDPNFYFQAGNLLFICLNTNCMEYDYSEPVPDFSFLENLIKNLPEGVDKTIVAMHVPPFDLEFNNNVAQIFQVYLKQFPNLQFCLNGHGHSYKVTDMFEDGVLYYMTPCAKAREYLIFTIKEEGHEVELVGY